MSAPLSGVITTLITPFLTSTDDLSGLTTRVDTFRVSVMMRCQARAGVAAVALAGWVGEGPTLSDAERRQLLETAIAAKDRLHVLAHVGSPSTARSIALAADAKACGADGLILVLPYYNRPTFAGIRQHISSVVAATTLPVYIEVDAGATGVRLSVAEIAELTRFDGVAGILDHDPNPLHVECKSSARRGTSFLAAFEPTAMASGLLGADGIFSAAANIEPCMVVELWRAIADNDVEAVRACHLRLLPLTTFIERHGVAGLKDLLQSRIGSERTVRRPLHLLDHADQRKALTILAALETYSHPRAVAR